MEWKDLPIDIQNRMLDYQEEQGNKRDSSVFERYIETNSNFGGFDWDHTKEGFEYWYEIVRAIPPKHISSYDDLIIGEYYWVRLSDKWVPALYKFNEHFIVGDIAVNRKDIKLENIEPCKHE